MIVRQPLCAAVGWIHASSVIADDRFSDAESATRTRLLDAVEAQRAAEACPAVVQVPAVIVPVLPLPETSATVVPAPSSKRVRGHQARRRRRRRRRGGRGHVGVAARLPDASTARTR